MPFCPVCRDEFVASVILCPDCECELVEDLSMVPEPPAPDTAEDEADTTPAVVVLRAPDEDRARSLVASLLAVSIPARVGREDEEGIPVEVPEEFGAAATSVVSRLRADDDAPMLDEKDLARLDLSPGRLVREGGAAVEGLIRVLVRGRGETAARAAFRLAAMGGEGVDALRGALARAVEVDDGGVSRAALRALRQEGHRETPAPLAELMGAEAPVVRIRALRTVAALGEAGALAHVVRSLRDPEPEVREEAADAVWELSGGAIDLDLDGDPGQVEARIRDLEGRYGG